VWGHAHNSFKIFQMKQIFVIGLLFLSFIGIGKGNGTCWLTSKTLELPNVNQAIGDTLSVANVSLWVAKNPVNTVDKEIQKIINKGSKYFLIKQTETFVTIGFMVDEREFLGVYAYSISKKNCKIISKEILAEELIWKSAFTSTYTFFQQGHIPTRISYKSSQSYKPYYSWRTNKTSVQMLLKNDGNWQIESTQAQIYQAQDSSTIWAISGLNMRQAPNLNSKKIITIPYGGAVKIIEKNTASPILKVNLQPEISFGKGKIPAIQIEGNWTKVRYKDKIGYVFDGFLSKLPALKIEIDTLENKVKQPIIKEKFDEWVSRNFIKFKTIPDKAIIYNNGITTSFEKSSGSIETTDVFPNMSLDKILLFYNVLLRVEYLNQDEDNDNDIWVIEKENKYIFKFRNNPYGDITLEQKGTSVIVNQSNYWRL